MKKKYFNNIMFGVSIVYLVGAIYLILTKKIEWNITNFFNTDGLALLGCIFATGELVLSKRNFISKKINQMMVCNKLIQYKLGVVLEIPREVTVMEIIDLFELQLKEALFQEEIKRKVIAEIKNDSCEILYDDVGFGIQVYRSYDKMNIRIGGKTKVGKLHSRKRDVLYLTSLLEILNNRFLQTELIRRNGIVKSVEMRILRSGSQVTVNNIFNEEINDVANYSVTINNRYVGEAQMVVNNDEFLLQVANISSLMNSFEDYIDILCTVM